MTNSQWGIVAIKMHISVWLYGRMGKVELAYQTSLEAQSIANETGDIWSKANANYALGVSYYLKGCLKEAEEHLLKSVGLLRKINQLAFAAIANAYLSAIYLDMGEYETSQKFIKRVFSFKHHAPSWLIRAKILLALAAGSPNLWRGQSTTEISENITKTED